MGPRTPQKKSRNRKTSLKCSERVRPSKRPAHRVGGEESNEEGKQHSGKAHSASCGACDLSGPPFLSGQPLKSWLFCPCYLFLWPYFFRVRKRRGRERSSCRRHSPSSKSRRQRVSLKEGTASFLHLSAVTAAPASALNPGL